MKASEKIRRSVKAVSPVISVLLMIVIAVAASLIAYAWIMGYIGGTTIKAGKAVLIQSMAKDAADGKLIVYVQNVGQGSVTIDSVYVNDVLTSFTTADAALDEGKTAELKVDFVVTSDERITVKVVTSDGTFTQTTGGAGGGTSILPAALDHFEFDPFGDQTAGVAFEITIRAIDQDGNAFTGYTGTNTLSVLSGTIDPTSTSAFTSGVWTGYVTVSPAGSGVTISTSGASKSGVSDPFNIGKASSTTSTQLSASSVTVGDSVTDTATVTPSAATGSVTFQYSTDGSIWNDLGDSKPLSSGQATSDSYTTTSAGTVYFRAIYGGDSSYFGSQSGDTDEALTVGVATPSVPAPTLNPPSPITQGESVTASVTVSGSVGTPTGTVTFEYSTDGGTIWNTLSAETLISGSATSDPYTPPSAGSNYRFRAVYGGDANYNSATGPATSLTVNPAAPQTIILRPNGQGSTTSLFPYPSGTYGVNWQRVDDTGSGDGDSTYVYKSGPGTDWVRDTYATEDYAGSGTINSVTIYIRCKALSGTWWARTAIRTHSQYYQGDQESLTDSWAVKSRTYLTNPNTGAAWTWAEINALECGVELKETGTGYEYEVRCTQVYIEVNYTPPP